MPHARALPRAARHVLRTLTVLTVALLLAPADARADAMTRGIVWNNFISGAGGFDRAYYRSSERNSTVLDSYTGDDAVFLAPTEVEAIEWVGLRRPGFTYAAADVIFLDSTFAKVIEYRDLPVTQDVVLGTLDNLTISRTMVKLPDDLKLSAGQYYYAARLVSDGGRSYIGSTGNGITYGSSMGVFQSEFFLGTDTWFRINQVTPRTTDFAYRLYGAFVPEPASLALLLAGALAIARRR